MDELKKYIILGHENPDVDSIVSGYLLEKLLLSKSFNVEFIIPDKKIEKDVVELCKEFGLDIEKLGYLKDLPTNKDYHYILVMKRCSIYHGSKNSEFYVTLIKVVFIISTNKASGRT